MKNKWILLFFMMSAFTQVKAQLTWSSPITISASTMDNSSDPHVVVDPNGNSTAAWLENGFVYASVQPVNGTWGTPVALSATGASSPRLGCDSSGNVTAIWLDSTGTVTLSTLPFNGTWSAATSISSSGAATPALAVNGAGTMVAVWERSGFIESVSKAAGGSLSLVSTLSAASSSNPSVSIGTNGTAVAVWQTILGTGAATVESATQTAGTWGSAVNILPAASAYSHNFPVVSVDAEGNADVIWFRYLNNNGVYSNLFVYAASLPSTSSSWSFPTQISDTGIGNPEALFIHISTDSSGDKMGVWSISYDGQSYLVESVLKPQSGTWTPFSFLASTPNIYTFQGDLAIDSIGNSTAVTMFFDGTSVNIQSAEASPSIIAGRPVWSSLATISTGTDNGFPVVGSNFNSSLQVAYATALWLTSNGTNTTVQASTGTKSPIASPSNLSVTQSLDNFGVFQDYYNTLSWTASPSGNVILYAIYRNGLLIQEVPPNVVQYIDHNAVQNGSVTYSVAAVDENLFLSQIISVTFP
jgi:hypothetical protein